MNNPLYQMLMRQKSEVLETPHPSFILRDGAEHLTKVLDSPLVKIVLGPRRCGKSTLIKQVLKNRSYAYLNCEDEGFPSGISGDEIMVALDQIYPNAKIYFFDEIQNFEKWEPFLHRLHREGRNCIVTGSNAHLLSRELASALTGRHIAIELLPFSYPEFLRCGQSDKDNALLHYLKSGGFPEVLVRGADEISYLGTLWDSIVLKDVVRRYKIRNVGELHDLYSMLLHAIGSRFNNDSLVRALNGRVSAPTVKKFLLYGNEAYLFAELPRFHYGTRKRLKFDRKAYVYDNGFLLAKKVFTSPDNGRLLENLVFIELVRQKYRPGLNLFYYVTADSYEVDFLLRQGSKNHELIQVTWNMSEQKTREREIRALQQAASELNVQKIRILTWDQAEILQIGGITIAIEPVRQWLVQQNQPQHKNTSY
jgi:predicted AAA+ superfamily ATPase